MAMKRLLSLLILITGGVCYSDAQTSDLNKRISTVKRDTTYLYAEATMKTADEAMEGAKAILEATVDDWLKQHCPDERIELCIAKAKEHCYNIQTRRGNYYRAFVYVKKNDLLPVSNRSEVVVFQIDSTSTVPIDTISKEPIDSLTRLATPLQSTSDSLSSVHLLSDAETEMQAITRFYQVEPYVKRLRENGQLEAYGKYATMPTEADCHLFVYNQEGAVEAVIRKKDGKQLNLRTLQEDDVRSYKNCGAIWIQLK